jgi:hypothetical protein
MEPFFIFIHTLTQSLATFNKIRRLITFIKKNFWYKEPVEVFDEPYINFVTIVVLKQGSLMDWIDTSVLRNHTNNFNTAYSSKILKY